MPGMELVVKNHRLSEISSKPPHAEELLQNLDTPPTQE
jgi:hypothetical protein